MKRAAEAIADALAEPEAEPEAEAEADAEPFRRFCHRPGQVCSKVKRSADQLQEAAEDALKEL